MVKSNESYECKCLCQLQGRLLSCPTDNVGDDVLIGVFKFRGNIYGTITFKDNIQNNITLQPVVVTYDMGMLTLFFNETGKLYTVDTEITYRKSWADQYASGLILLDCENFAVEQQGKSCTLLFYDGLGRLMRSSQIKTLSLMNGMCKVITQNSTKVLDLI